MYIDKFYYSKTIHGSFKFRHDITRTHIANDIKKKQPISLPCVTLKKQIRIKVRTSVTLQICWLLKINVHEFLKLKFFFSRFKKKLKFSEIQPLCYFNVLIYYLIVLFVVLCILLCIARLPQPSPWSRPWLVLSVSVG